MMEFLSEFVWLEFLSEYLIKSTLILILGITLSYLCRRQSASLRHHILSVSLIGILIFPLLSTVSTGWKTGLLPSWTGIATASTKGGPSLSAHLRSPSISIDNAQEELQSHGNGYPVDPAWAGKTDPVFWNLMKYGLLALWLFGMIFILMRQLFGLYGAYKLSQEAEDLKSPFWNHLLCRFLEVVSFKKKVDLLHHTKVKVPLTWGWLKPVVIMPDDSESWTEEQRESALYHELSHVKRRDFLVLMLARISLGLYWFNPLCWWIFNRMKNEQEKACDEMVLKTGIKPSTYAANLLSIQRSIQSPWNPPSTAVGALGKSQLNDRLLAILKQKFTIKEVNMKTKIFFSVLVILTITFLGMARPSSPSEDRQVFSTGDVCLETDSSPAIEVQEDKKEKKDQKKTEETEDKEKKKDVFVWHINEGEEGEVEVIIKDKGKVKSFTLKEPVIIIKKDESGKEIAITSEGKAIDIKKGEKGTWVAKGDVVTLHKEMETIDLGEGSVVTLKTRTKDGAKIIEFEAPVVVVKKIDDTPKGITLKVSEEGGKKKTVVVTPHVDLKHHPDVHIQMKETELKKIHEKLQKIYKQLATEMESKSEEEEQALKEMEELLKKMEKKLEAMEPKVKDISLSLHEEPHVIKLKHGKAISIKHKTGTVETEKDWAHMSIDKGHIVSFVDEEGEITFLSHLELKNIQKQAFDDAVGEIGKKLPQGYAIESEFDEDSGLATIKIKGRSTGKDTMDEVIELFKGLKEKLTTKN